jgi:hypothetical protein
MLYDILPLQLRCNVCLTAFDSEQVTKLYGAETDNANCALYANDAC